MGGLHDRDMRSAEEMFERKVVKNSVADKSAMT
jgi:hypothetical protein